jgi:hypothetical protein
MNSRDGAAASVNLSSLWRLETEMATTTVTRSNNTNGSGPAQDVTPEEAAAIRSSIAGPEQAPSQRQQAGNIDWRKIMDQLGDPYSVERIPLSKLRMMRRDPTIGFGLSFIKTPHIRARWYIDAKDENGPNAQVASHLDHDLRRIMPSLVLQWCNSLDFGFQAIAKRFEFAIPAGTYVAQQPDGTMQEVPIWSNGGIQPVRWKPFVPLPPEVVDANWSDADGSFNGINYDASASGGNAPSGTGATPGKEENKFDIDLYHSLWVTNERDQNFGSIFGYPRLGYAYKPWWSYWFRWSIADRAFEKKADPSILIYHPEGKFIDPASGQEIAYSDYALQMGNRMRSGGIITLPSSPYEGVNGPTNVREWEIDFTSGGIDFDPFDKSFDYLDIAKIRSLWIPEQSLVEGKGGTSSRNVAAQLDSSFTESQAVLSVQIQETINRWVIPQWIAVNYPEFLQANGTAQVVIQGFADEDVAFTQQILQLIGQQATGVNKILTIVDLQKIINDAGVPVLDIQSQQTAQQQLIEQLQATGGTAPNPVAPKAGAGGTVGVVPAGTVPTDPSSGNGGTDVGGTGKSSATGFSYQYIQPREVIYLSTGETTPKVKVRKVDDVGDKLLARYDPDENTVYLADGISEEDQAKYLTAIGEALVAA